MKIQTRSDGYTTQRPTLTADQQSWIIDLWNSGTLTPGFLVRYINGTPLMGPPHEPIALGLDTKAYDAAMQAILDGWDVDNDANTAQLVMKAHHKYVRLAG